MTKEAQFVAECVRRTLVPLWQTESGRSLSGGVEWTDVDASLSWDRVLEIARGNAVVPLVTAALDDDEWLDAADVTVPDEVRSRLRSTNRHNAARNLSLAGALHRVLEVLESAGVRAIPFKGPVLATTAYGDLTRRSFGDIDLLISEPQRETARTTLQENGFERVDPYSDPEIDRSRVLTRPVKEYEFRELDGESHVELRWSFETTGLPSFETLWDRRTTATVAGEAVPALAPVDVVLTQATHLTQHACRRLAWMADVAAATARVHDWDRLLAAVETRGLRHRVSVALRIAVQLFDAPVPARLWQAGRLPDCSASATAAIERWLRSPVDTTTLLDEFRFKAGLLPPRDALRAVVDTVFVPRYDEYEALPLPPALHPLYYVYRPLRLAARYGPWSDATHPSRQ